MSKGWWYILIGVTFEMFWVNGLAHADTWYWWVLTVVGLIGSFYFILLADRVLPVGTVYAVFVGLGTVGAVSTGTWLFDEPLPLSKILLVLLLLVGVVGLKMVTEEE
jgi:paired small multidrug resistance pump